MERIKRDFRGLRIALPPEYRKPSENDGEHDPFQIIADFVNLGGRSLSRLTFVSLCHVSFGGDPRMGAARITYYPRENSDGSIDLCRSDRLVLTPPENLDEVQSACDPVLCRDIERFELTFIDHQGDERDHWDSDSGAFDLTTPRAIHLAMAFHLFDRSSLLGSHRGGVAGDGNSGRNNDGDISEKALVKRVLTQFNLPLFRVSKSGR